ncbi:MAG: AI-2E family transporter [Bacteriovoracaceae bacterium]|nr:AI-2E family transporter [Bacteriovoracaceae bacterium]
MFLFIMERVKITNGTIVFSLFLIALIIIAVLTRYLLITALIGVGIGTLLAPVLNKLRAKLHFPRFLSAMVVLVTMVLFLGVIFTSIYYLAADQFNTLVERSPQIYNSLNAWASDMFSRYPWLKEQAGQFDVGKTAQASVINILKGFQLGIIAISGAVFAFMIGLYTAINSQEYFSSTAEAFPPKYRSKAREVMSECGSVLQSWFKAQLIDMVIIGSLTGLGLWVLKIDYWAVFGLLTAVMGLIPYVGIFLVVFVASLITLTTDPGQVPWVLLVFIITQQLEGNVILPLVMKGKVELPVVHLLTFMLLMGSFFGVIGVFLGPPLFAILRTIYKMIYLPYISQPFEAPHR